VNYSCSLASFRSKQAFPTLPNPTHPRMCVSGEEMEKQEREMVLNIKRVKHLNEAKERFSKLNVGVGFSRLNFPHDLVSLPTASVKLAFQYL